MNYTTTTTTTTIETPPLQNNTMKLSEPYITPNTTTTTATTSTWQQLVVGASSAAGSTAAVVSEESMKCLRYCLSWLQYAIRHIGQQMGLLRNFLVTLATSQQQQEQEQKPMLLASIKRDMVTTLRKVIDIITCYASNALPYQAKATVRGTILNLPSRWATLNDETSSLTTTNDDSVTARQTKGQEDVALRLLAFGQESTDMLGSIHNVFDDTIQRAETWLERLRMINPLSNNNQLPPVENTTTDDDDFYNVLLPPIRNLHISTSATTSSS